MQKGPSYSSSAATSPEKSANAQSRKSVSIRACAFFPPRLDPVLNSRKGHKDAMVAPQLPTRGTVGQAVLDHQPHRQIHHTVGVLTAWWRQIGQVCIEVLATLGAVMLRIGDHKITRTPQVEMRAGRCWGLGGQWYLLHLKIHVRIPPLKNGAELPVQRPHSRL